MWVVKVAGWRTGEDVLVRVSSVRDGKVRVHSRSIAQGRYLDPSIGPRREVPSLLVRRVDVAVDQPK
jgi:hypothetical protein